MEQSHFKDASEHSHSTLVSLLLCYLLWMSLITWPFFALTRFWRKFLETPVGLWEGPLLRFFSASTQKGPGKAAQAIFGPKCMVLGGTDFLLECPPSAQNGHF